MGQCNCKKASDQPCVITAEIDLDYLEKYADRYLLWKTGEGTSISCAECRQSERG